MTLTYLDSLLQLLLDGMFVLEEEAHVVDDAANIWALDHEVVVEVEQLGDGEVEQLLEL